jgi:hypothetical protein
VGDGLPGITGKVRIYGDATTVERDSAESFRIFHVRQGGSLSLKSLTVRGGETSTRHEQSKGDSTKQTPHTVTLIRSAAFKNFPTNCAPPGSVPRCDAVGSAPGTKAGARRGS